MNEAHELGKKGETLAKNYLSPKKYYRIALQLAMAKSRNRYHR